MQRPVFKRFLAAAVAGVLGLGVVPAALAQGRPGNPQRASDHRPPEPGSPRGPIKWWDAYRSDLHLTQDQWTRVNAIFESTFPQLKASYEELNKREQQLSALISANDATEAQVLRLADQIEAIRGELAKTRVLMLFRMRRVLSPEQRDKLQELQKQRERDRGEPPRR